ncbi:MAG: LytTR family DNA-binding domain-containing protein [Clostridia bacterium]
MKIAVCDDDMAELTRISSLLGDYRLEKKVGFTYKAYQSSFELLEDMRSNSFDLLFLDILMPGINGMQAAHEIRTFDENAKIIFLTSSPEFAVESYSVGATTYLLKPIMKEMLFAVLDKIFSTTKRADDCLAVKCKTGIIKVLFSKLSYVEVLGKVLSFHMSDDTIYKTTAPLSEYEEAILLRPEFVRVHRSFLVNLWQMRELSSMDFITLSGVTVPISRRLYPQVRDLYMKSLFSKKEVE